MNTSTSQQIKKTDIASCGDTVLGLVVLGLLAAGVVAIFKATSMTSGLDVMLCLFGSVAAFGGVYYILFGRLHTIMENTQTKPTTTEAAGYAAGVGIGTCRALFRGKHVSAAIIVLAGAILLLGASWLIHHNDTKLFVQVVGCIVGVVGLVGWIFSTTKS